MRKHAGFSLIELLIVVAIILTIAAIAIPSLVRSRIAANEASAVSAIRTLTTAETTYAQTYPDLGYTCSLTDLGPGATYTSTSAGIIDSVLAGGHKAGYSFNITNCTGTPKVTYTTSSVPVQPGSSGVRAFCSDASGVVKYDGSGSSSTCISAGTVLQ